MKRIYAPTLMGIIGTAGGLTVLLAFPVEKIHPAIPTIKVPGAYPYEETVRIPAPPPLPESSPLPSPAPFSYSDSLSPAPARYSQTAKPRRPLTAKTVRKTAFKHNGVPSFCGFLAAFPADVGVFDSKLGRTRALVKGGRVIPKNVVWLRKHEQARSTLTKRNPRPKDRAFARFEKIGARNSGI
jgi:hypothetical protein